MILEFNFISASSEGSDEPVHLHTLARALSILITQNMLADEDSDQILANTNNIHQTCRRTIRIFNDSDNWIIKACERLSIIDY